MDVDPEYYAVFINFLNGLSAAVDEKEYEGTLSKKVIPDRPPPFLLKNQVVLLLTEILAQSRRRAC